MYKICTNHRDQPAEDIQLLESLLDLRNSSGKCCRRQEVLSPRVRTVRLLHFRQRFPRYTHTLESWAEDRTNDWSRYQYLQDAMRIDNNFQEVKQTIDLEHFLLNQVGCVSRGFHRMVIPETSCDDIQV